MKTPIEIMTTIDKWSNVQLKENYELLMLEIMCNIAMTLDKLAKQYEYEGDE